MSQFFAPPIPLVFFVKYVLVLFLCVPEYGLGTIDRLRLGYGCLGNCQILKLLTQILYSYCITVLVELLVNNVHMFMYCKLCFYAAFVRFNLLVIF